MVRRLALLAALVTAGAAVAGAQAPPAPAGFTVLPVLDNATVGVSRLQLAPGAREQPHTHPYPMLVVLLSRSDVEMRNGTVHTRTTRNVGDFEFVDRNVPHAAANVGAAPLDALVLALKPERVRGGTAPPPQALPGLSRSLKLDNPDLSVTRLEFDPDIRESVHTHPYDLVIVPLTHARIDLQLGAKKDVRSYGTGQAIFVPKGVPHAVANVGTAPFRILGVAIK